MKSEINFNMTNPWSCQSLYDYLYFCCPECDSKCQIKQDFVNHAIDEHPESLSFFRLIEDNSIEDVHLPNHHEDGSDEFVKPVIDVKVEVDEDIENHETEGENDSNRVIEDLCLKVENQDVVPEDISAPVKSTKNRKKNLKRDKANISKDPKKPKLCTLCGETFALTYQLKVHELRKHEITSDFITERTGDVKIQCDNCQETFETTSKLNEHAMTCGNEDPKTFSCSLCGLQLAAGKAFLIHMKIDHGQINAVSCNFCGKCLSQESALKYHIKVTHEKQFDHMCDTCGSGFGSLGALKSHIETVHDKSEGDIQCDYCEKKFKTKGNKKRHINRVHTKSTQFSCEQCGTICFTRYDLKKHQHMVHEGDKYRNVLCPHCDFKTFTKHKLERHINSIHKSEVEYSCDFCQSFVCYGQDSMREHMKDVHNQNASSFRPRKKKALLDGAFSCPECEFKTNHKQNVKKHIAAVHCGGKDQKTKFHCDMCDYSSFAKDKLKSHRDYKHFNKPKPFPCQNCNKGFESRRDLVTHLSKCSTPHC